MSLSNIPISISIADLQWCDRYIDASTGVGVIESPNYPFDYKNNQDCVNKIIIPPNSFDPGTKKMPLSCLNGPGNV